MLPDLQDLQGRTKGNALGSHFGTSIGDPSLIPLKAKRSTKGSNKGSDRQKYNVYDTIDDDDEDDGSEYMKAEDMVPMPAAGSKVKVLLPMPARVREEGRQDCKYYL